MAAAAPPGRQRGALEQGFALRGEPPSPIDPPPGCRFAARCPFAEDRCRREMPQLSVRQPQHFVACHRADEVAAAGQRIMRSEEHTSELQSLMRTSYAVFCWKKKTTQTTDENQSET